MCICLYHCHPRIVCVISFQKIYGLMIYKAVEVIWIFSTGRVEIEGTLRGPRGPNNSHKEKMKLIKSKKHKLVLLKLLQKAKARAGAPEHELVLLKMATSFFN